MDNQSQDEEWTVGVLMSDGFVALTDPVRYASEQQADAEARRQKHIKPFMNYVAVRA